MRGQHFIFNPCSWVQYRKQSYEGTGLVELLEPPLFEFTRRRDGISRPEVETGSRKQVAADLARTPRIAGVPWIPWVARVARVTEALAPRGNENSEPGQEGVQWIR